jgi:Domain of unknown function (DUF4902)
MDDVMTYQKRVFFHDRIDLRWCHDNSWLDADVLEEPYSGTSLRSGCTEWTAAYGDQTLSLGWDWMMTHDGLVKPYFSAPPRSNFLWLDDGGQAVSFNDQISALQQIPLSVPWSDFVLSVAR